MVPCFKTYFNTPSNWDALNGDAGATTSATSEFRYLSLIYVMFAKKQHPDIYAKILASEETKKTYTSIVRYAEQVSKDWEVAMKGVGRDTKTDFGWDNYWLFYNEIHKQEYQDVEKLLLIAPVNIAGRLPDSHSDLAWMRGKQVSMAVYDLRGNQIHSLTLGDGARELQNAWTDLSREFNPQNHVLRISNGKQVVSRRLDAFPQELR